MSVNRKSRNEAWIASLVVHAILLAGLIALWGRPRDLGPVAARSAYRGLEVGVITLAEPVPRVMEAVAPSPLPPAVIVGARPVQPPPPQPGPVRTASHQETTPTTWVPAVPSVRPVPGPASASPAAGGPVAHAPGSASSVNKTPVAGVPAVGGAPPGSPNSRPLPPGAVTAFFGVPALGTSVVFVLDRSASMGLDGRLDRARRELAASLRSMPPSTRFQVIAYNRAAEPVRLPATTGLLAATPAAVDAVIAVVERLPAEGGSDHAAALTAALALAPDVIYFLTDEDDLALRDVQAVTRRNQGRASIHAICLTPVTGETPMRALARENRGVFRVADR